jgi:hypothetical protein
MNRRIFGFGVSMLSLLPFLSGCTEMRPWLRPRSDDPSRIRPTEDENENGKDKVLDVQSDSKPFFKSSRLSGAMSSEGREIERSLGIQ